MTTSKLQDLLVTNLLRHRGGAQRHWHSLVRPVRLYDTATHAHCNGLVHASKDAAENGAIKRLLDAVRLTQPIIAAS